MLRNWIITFLFAVCFVLSATSVRAIELTLEDLPGDIHEGSSIASEYSQNIFLRLSGFGSSQVRVNVTVNGSSDVLETGTLMLDGPVNATRYVWPGTLVSLNDPAEIAWQNSFVGPKDVSVTFQAVDENGNQSALLTRRFTVRAIGVPPPNPGATIDRHPELKSRAVAWTEFDGSYRFDTSSRAEMLDVFWNVFNKPYGEHGWTGSVNPPVAGTTSERWRIREYAQLSAYRWLNGSAPVNEDPEKLDFVQAAALVFAQNPAKDLTHNVQGYVGYNTAAALAAAQSLLNANGDDTKQVPTPVIYLTGSSDIFIADADSRNAATVGHRTRLLHNNSTLAALGSAVQDVPAGNVTISSYVNIWNTAFVTDIDASREHFIAYPSPGYFPLAMLPIRAEAFSWSFVTASDLTSTRAAAFGLSADPGVVLKDAYITAKINGVPVAINMVGNGTAPTPLTWNFGTLLDTAADGTTVDITIHDIAMLNDNLTRVIGYRDYHYTVTLFDPTRIVTVGYSPKAPLTNISTRSVIGSGDRQMIAGFTVAGTEPVRVAVRTQGPGLRQYGIQNPAAMTHIRVYDQATNTLMGENTSWKQHPNWRLLQSLNVAPSQEAEAGMVLTLWPGSYTAVVGDDTNANGVGIVEAFDIDNLSNSKLTNLSTRSLVGAGENQMIAGISIKDTPRTLVIRTQGPGLTKYGVTGAVTDTVLSIVALSDGQTVAENDDWQTDSRNARLKTDLTWAAPSDDREAALIVTLPPGGYTALVSAKGPPGVGIVEVFDVN